MEQGRQLLRPRMAGSRREPWERAEGGLCFLRPQEQDPAGQGQEKGGSPRPRLWQNRCRNLSFGKEGAWLCQSLLSPLGPWSAGAHSRCRPSLWLPACGRAVAVACPLG